MHRFPLLALALLAGCSRAPAPPSQANGDISARAIAPPTTAVEPREPASFSATPAAAVAAALPDHFEALGTEPFWSITVAAERLIYMTPDDQAGKATTITRAAGAADTRFSGKLGGAPLLLVIARGNCSDGMSDRKYQFTAHLTVANHRRQGCARLLDQKENTR